ncbi:hypothetical protein DB88DRAFT_499159 [Papiliotrema laurentii]|uniref:Nuclear fusion protein KAR5 n=1 Tax=Papiliotrema laurentii TaxID=5418 RepID=A0AAD9CZ43_PAPLA|nr:hypothetical protein DB88DRAFT_499159 [Papiliotrema laurentii]
MRFEPLYVVLLSPLAAFSTPAQPLDQVTRQLSFQLQQLGDTHSQHQDCHTSIASLVSVQCGRGGDGMDEKDRSALSIAFTICSMFSASQPVPHECSFWASIPTKPPEALSPDPRDCLAVLHRSPQDWSTYQGFLRDATQLCLALDGQRQADIAKDTYINATREKLHLLALLQTHEEHRERENVVIRELIKERMAAIKASFVSAEHLLLDLSLETERQHQALNDLDSLLSRLKSEGLNLLERLHADAISRSFETTNTVESSMREIKNSVISKVSEELAYLIQMHGDHLHSQQDDYASALARLIDSERVALGELSSQHMSKLESKYANLALDIQHSHSSLSSLRHDANVTLQLLHASQAQTIKSWTVQNETLATLIETAVTAKNLTAALLHAQNIVDTTLATANSWKHRSWAIPQLLAYGLSGSPFVALIFATLRTLFNIILTVLVASLAIFSARMRKVFLWIWRVLRQDLVLQTGLYVNR